MSTDWMIDELAYAGPEHLDADFIAAYDRKQGYPSSAEDLQWETGLTLEGKGPTESGQTSILLEVSSSRE